MEKVIRARAPLRISFGGGGTDVTPYADERGGRVINATINRYAYATLVPNDADEIRLHSLDYEASTTYAVGASLPDSRYEWRLAGGVIRHFEDRLPSGFDLYTHTDCPPGSGLGASSTLVVALIGALDRWLQCGLDRYETARLACRIERRDLGIEGGKQDQYAAAFGGFNFMEFEAGGVLVNPLRVPPEWVCELEYALVLAYTGLSRASPDIIADQIDNYRQRREQAVEAMDRTKALASEMKRALLTGRFEAFGALLHRAWLVKKQMSDRISNPHIDDLYEAARAQGALGGKVSGAGGGGFMFFFTGFDRRQHVMEALEQRGAKVVHFGFADTGMQTWIR